MMADTTTRTLVTRKGREIETPYSDEEAFNRLRGYLETRELTSSFARSIGSNFLPSMSRDQRTWVHILVVEHERKKDSDDSPETDASVVPIPGSTDVLRMLTLAREKGVKWPKIRTLADVRMGLCGDRSRYAGLVAVESNTRPEDERRAWYGYIDRDGNLHPSAKCTPAVVDALVQFCRDPIGQAKIHGKRTDHCCFCGRELETKESLFVGYGPICAGKFGLPWGEIDERTLTEEVKDEIEGGAA